MAGDSPEPCNTPSPGPMYWEYRCMVCGHNIADHDPLLTRLGRAWREWRAHR